MGAPVVVREILVPLGCWQPEAPERAPPVAPEAWPAHASLALSLTTPFPTSLEAAQEQGGRSACAPALA